MKLIEVEQLTKYNAIHLTHQFLGLNPLEEFLMPENTVRLMCLPVYSVHDWPVADDVNLLGSGTLIRFRGRHLLLTAAHVLESTDVILLGGVTPAVPLRRPNCTRTDNHCGLDIDFIDISEQIAAFSNSPVLVIDWERMLCDQGGDCSTPLCKIIGFPAHRNEARQDVRSLSMNVVDVQVREDARIIRHTQFREVAANRNLYIGLRYEPFLLNRNSNSRPRIRAFHGFSGGAIWQMGVSTVWHFAGLVTDCHSSRPTRRGERLLIGLRTMAIDTFLRERIEDPA